jgi:hypothetical protein
VTAKAMLRPVKSAAGTTTTKSTRMQLSDCVSVRGRFHRSVNLGHDWRDANALAEYILTPTAQEFAAQVMEELSRPQGTRAWSITGPYGSGKSALALFLADVLAAERPVCRESAVLRKRRGRKSPPFIPVLAVAERQPLAATIAHAFAASLEHAGQAKLARRFRKLAKSENPEAALITAIQEAAETVHEAKRGGLLIVIDEMGKFLEYAADNDLDLFLLQQLAEAAARSAVPIVLVTILHAGFSDYLPVGDDVRRVEWQKVQGRFRDVPFHLPAEQLLGLVGHALEKRWTPAIERRWRAEVDRMFAQADGWGGAREQQGVRSKLFVGTYPFHPVTALLLWPIFRSKLAQNERSLFAFLTSYEPSGFREFLGQPIEASDGSTELTVFLPWDLYDYVSLSLGIAAFRGDQARRWSLIEHALTRLPADSPAWTVEAVKAVGLIGMYGAAVGVRASPATLRILLGADADDTVRYLQERSILVYRRHTDAFALWEGSDIDLDAAFTEAAARTVSGDLAGRLGRALLLRPVVARAHYIETGTLRLFQTGVVAAEQGALARELARPSDQDGRLLFAVGAISTDPVELVARASERAGVAIGPLTIVAFPHPAHGLEEALREVEAWASVRDTVPDLAADPVARQEVRARVAASRERLERIAGRIFGLPGHAFDPSLSTWVADGSLHPLESAPAFQRWLSDKCNRVYDASPILRNELVNSTALSSAASAARRNLFERMLTHEDKPRLGIEGAPPEAAIYASMLSASRIHDSRDHQWSIGRPTEAGKWQRTWDAAVAFVQHSQDARRPLPELYAHLASPPFGIREGPAAVLIVAVLISMRDEVALYEDDMFVTDFRIELLERLTRRPATFALQSLRLTTEQRVALRELRKLMTPTRQGIESQLDLSENAAPQVSLVEIARVLIRAITQLNDYTRRTRRLSVPAAEAVRSATERARDPRQLLFQDLPAILECQLEDRKGAEAFATALHTCVTALRDAYPRLLDDIEERVRQAFGLESRGADAWSELRQRVRVVKAYATERRLKHFVTEVDSNFRAGDWREAVARAVEGGKPPSSWSDLDSDHFGVHVVELAEELSRLSTIALARGEKGVQEVVRLDVLGAEGHGEHVIIPLTKELEHEAQSLTARIQALLSRGKNQPAAFSNHIRLVALARAAVDILREPSQEGA